MTTVKTMTMAVLTVPSPPLLTLYATKNNTNKLNNKNKNFSSLNSNSTYKAEKVDKLLADNLNEKWVKILFDKSGKPTSTKQLLSQFCPYKKYIKDITSIHYTAESNIMTTTRSSRKKASNAEPKGEQEDGWSTVSSKSSKRSKSKITSDNKSVTKQHKLSKSIKSSKSTSSPKKSSSDRSSLKNAATTQESSKLTRSKSTTIKKSTPTKQTK